MGHVTRRITIFVVLTLALMPFQNCGIVQAPSGASLPSLAGFDHSGITTNCNSCHASSASFNAFPAVGHPLTAGLDCLYCHNTSNWISAGIGSAGTNPHGNGRGLPPSCVACHISNQPTGQQGSVSIVGNLTPVGGFFTHDFTAGTQDCATCHSAVPANAGVTFSGAIYPHSPTPTSCRPCHTNAQQPVGVVGGMDHAIGGTGDCAGCHSTPVSNIGKIWQ